MEKRLACFVLIVILSGCLGQAPILQSTRTPSSTPQTVMPVPTTTPPPTTITPTTLPPVTVPPTTAPPTPPKDYNSIMKDLEKNFPKLASELKELPELKGNPSDSEVEALNDIYYLWKNATNPEVKEAFDLMLKGGTPSQKDFTYQIPTYNTELKVLFWLAEQNEFHFNDTLGQAIAIVNGLWVTMGDDEVRKAVKKDTNDLLNYFRETNEWQREKGFYLLEEYPLEAKAALVWMAPQVFRIGAYPLIDYQNKKMKVDEYNWNNISPETLINMRNYLEIDKMIHRDLEEMESIIVNFTTFSRKWKYKTWRFDKSLDIRYHSLDVDYQYNYNFMRHGYFEGDCGLMDAISEALNKSMGISTSSIWIGTNKDGKILSDTHFIYYDPNKKSWYKNLLLGTNGNKNVPLWNEISPSDRIGLEIYRLPVIQENFLSKITIIIRDTSWNSYNDSFNRGIPTSQMKQWLLYS